jgi:hypothetical protein
MRPNPGAAFWAFGMLPLALGCAAATATPMPGALLSGASSGPPATWSAKPRAVTPFTHRCVYICLG